MVFRFDDRLMLNTAFWMVATKSFSARWMLLVMSTRPAQAAFLPDQTGLLHVPWTPASTVWVTTGSSKAITPCEVASFPA
eukprot:6830363-Pyramimonas_sp.AAC.1